MIFVSVASDLEAPFNWCASNVDYPVFYYSTSGSVRLVITNSVTKLHKAHIKHDRRIHLFGLMFRHYFQFEKSEDATLFIIAFGGDEVSKEHLEDEFGETLEHI